MENLFISILNFSITASYVVLIVLVARWVLLKTPRRYSIYLWTFVFARFVTDFNFTSKFSLLRMFQDMQHVPANIGLMQTPQIDIGLNSLNHIINQTLPAATPINSVNPMQSITFALSALWLAGICILVSYSLLSYFILKFRLKNAVKESDDVYSSDRIQTPFVLGLVRPRIYLPARVSSLERDYICEHERTHIQSLDHFTKIFSFFIVCVHWFNPLAWLSFKLLSKDLEIRCDEKVLNGKDKTSKTSYATSLLSYSGNRSPMLPNPLAFGESNTKSRIKRILSYKKPALLVSTFALISILILGFAVLSNPISSSQVISKEMNSKLDRTRDQYNRGFTSYTFGQVFGEKSRKIIEVDGVKVIQQVLDNKVLVVTFNYSLNGEPLNIDFQQLNVSNKNLGTLGYSLMTIYYGKINSWPFPEIDAKKADEAYDLNDSTWTFGADVVVTCFEPYIHYGMKWVKK